MKASFISIKLAIIFTILCANSYSVQAQDSLLVQDQSWDQFSVSAGGFLASYNSGIAYASKQLGLGIQIDVEDALGLESTQLAFRGNAIYKFGKKNNHSATFGYFGIFRNSKKVLDKELELGGAIFPIGTAIKSSFEITIIRTKYDYSFFQDDRVSLGASFGLFIMPVSLTVSAISNQEKRTKFTAPLPLLGLRSDFKISEKLYLNQSVEILYLSFSDFAGSMLDLNIALEHKTFNHIALGLGVNSNRLNISIKNQDSPVEFFGDIKMDYTGLLFYGKYYF